MAILRHRWKRDILLVLIGAVLLGCAPKVKTDLIHSSSLVQVRLVHGVDKEGAPIDEGFQHPISFSQEEVGLIFRSITTKHRKGLFGGLTRGAQPKDGRAFTKEEVGQMSGGIGKAFTKATPADRVHFELKHPRGILAPRVTKGILYVENDRLILFFNKYRYVPTIGEEEDPNRFDDIVALPSAQNVLVIPGPFQELHPAKHSYVSNRWLIIDYQGLLKSIPAAEAHETKIEMGLEERLQLLKRWVEQGLISQEEYEKEKAEVLEKF